MTGTGLLLARLAREVAACRTLLAEVERAALAATPAAGAGMQALDRLDQRLQDMALFLDRLALLAGDQALDAGPALAGLRLGELRAALGGSAPPGAGHAPLLFR